MCSGDVFQNLTELQAKIHSFPLSITKLSKSIFWFPARARILYITGYFVFSPFFAKIKATSLFISNGFTLVNSFTRETLNGVFSLVIFMSFLSLLKFRKPLPEGICYIGLIRNAIVPPSFKYTSEHT